MSEIQQKTGISQAELLYNLVSGLKIVKKNLLKYPEEIQLKQAFFTFSVKKTVETGIKVAAIIGFENSNVKEYSEVETSTWDFGSEPRVKFNSVEFEWAEIGINLQLEFAGQIMRAIADEIIVSRATGVPVTNKEILMSYSISKSNAGLLELKFLNDFVEVSANRKLAKAITNNVKIVFALKSAEEPVALT